jgi:hypothetical protein
MPDTTMRILSPELNQPIALSDPLPFRPRPKPPLAGFQNWLWAFAFIAITIIPAAAGAQEARLKNITISSEEEKLLVSLEVEGAFTQNVMEAILRGVPADFSFLIKLDRSRSWWADEELADIEVTHTIKYDNLKKEFAVYRSWIDAKPIITQSLAEAQSLMSHIRGLTVIDIHKMQKNQQYHLQAKAELREMTLPFYLHYVFYFVSLWDFETDWHSVVFVY